MVIIRQTDTCLIINKQPKINIFRVFIYNLYLDRKYLINTFDKGTTRYLPSSYFITREIH